MAPRRAVAPLVLALVSTLVGLAALEAVFRARARLADTGSLEDAAASRPAPGSRVRLGDIVRPSPNPRIVYELVPGLDVTFLRQPLRTSADGFRGPELGAGRTRPAVRVVGLGDSVMFGWGVREEDAYLSLLPALLGPATPGVAWEVVNTAVPGYNTVMEVETLEAKGLRFDPDLVVLNFVGNDLGLPNFVEERPDVLSLRRSFLLEFVRARLGGEPEPGPRLVGVGPEMRRFGGEADLARVPERFRHLVGPQPFRAALERLRALSRERGFEVLVIAHPEVFGYARDAATELSLPLVETGAAVREWARARGIVDLQRPPLTVTDADPHPAPAGHAIIADVLAAHLRQTGLADRLAARRRAGAGATPAPAP
jgi:lysophospholipase L1-like esterase